MASAAAWAEVEASCFSLKTVIRNPYPDFEVRTL
jgi:hypothetical protein